MARTTTTLVEKLLGNDYDRKRRPDLTPRIETANVLVSRVQTAAIDKGVTLTDAELELLERWMAAHYYTKSDPTYSSRSTGGASGSFIRSGSEPEPYLDGALSIDYSGCLRGIVKGQIVTGFYLGHPHESR